MTTSSDNPGRSIVLPQSYHSNLNGYATVAWSMSDSSQRLYANGFSYSSNSFSAANRYESAQITLRGANRAIHEMVLYNFDMLGYDVQIAADH